MGLLSSLFGGSKNSSETTQRQDSYGYSVSGGSSTSTSGGYSTGLSMGLTGSSQGVFGADVFQQLFQGALGAAGAIDPSLATQRVNQLFTGGASIIEQLAGGGAGAAYLEGRLSGDNDLLNQQVDALGSDLGRFLREELNPVIRGSAVAGGALGGGRQGVAEGLAAEGVAREFTRGATELRSADIARRDQAALGLLQLTGQNSATALSSLSQLAQLGSGTEALAPYAALSDILGGPTVLTESFGQEMSVQQAEEYAQALSEEFGISYDEAHALLTSKSKGKSSGGIVPGLASLGSSFMGAG